MDDIYLTIESIAKNYNEKLFKKYQSKYKSLGNTFYFYREKLMSLKDEFIINFHDGRDFYNIKYDAQKDLITYKTKEHRSILDGNEDGLYEILETRIPSYSIPDYYLNMHTQKLIKSTNVMLTL